MRKNMTMNGDGMKVSEIITLLVLIWASLSIFVGEVAIPLDYVIKGIADPDRTIFDYFIEAGDVK